MSATIAHPSVPTGHIKSFGYLGPKYEVGQPLKELPSGDWLIEIEVLETGEKAEYPLSDIKNDPEAE